MNVRRLFVTGILVLFVAISVLSHINEFLFDSSKQHLSQSPEINDSLSDNKLNIHDMSLQLASQDIQVDRILIEAFGSETVYSWIQYKNISPYEQEIAFSTTNFDGIKVDLKHLVAWYKDSNAEISVKHGGKTKLVEELLLNNPMLIDRDDVNRRNRIRFIAGGQARYMKTSELEKFIPARDGRIRMDVSEYFIRDSENIDARTIRPGESFKILLRFDVENIVGVQQGDLTIKSNGKVYDLPIIIDVQGHVLQPPRLEYSVFYRGLLDKHKDTMSSERKAPQQLRAEFSHIGSARYVNPVIYEPAKNRKNFQQYISIRNEQLGSAKKIYLFDSYISRLVKENRRRVLGDHLKMIRENLEEFDDVYVLVDDEPRGNDVKKSIQLRDFFSQFGFKMFITGREKDLTKYIVEGVIYVVAYEPKAELAERIHQAGSSIFSYANPQVGVIDPASIRHNYGVKLLKANYDGSMLYAYQDSRGSAWSDFDGKYRDHMFSYPTSSGVINTVSWVAYHQAIQDVQYVSTLSGAIENFRNSECYNSTIESDAQNIVEQISYVKKGYEEDYRKLIRRALLELSSASAC